jgi:hypothetical protein
LIHRFQNQVFRTLYLPLRRVPHISPLVGEMWEMKQVLTIQRYALVVSFGARPVNFPPLPTKAW